MGAWVENISLRKHEAPTFVRAFCRPGIPSPRSDKNYTTDAACSGKKWKKKVALRISGIMSPCLSGKVPGAAGEGVKGIDW